MIILFYILLTIPPRKIVTPYYTKIELGKNIDAIIFNDGDEI